MIDRLRESTRTPAARGFIMLAVMAVCYGFAYSANTNTVTNFFEEILHFKGPEFGYITAVREVGGLLLIILMAHGHRAQRRRRSVQ